MLTPTPQAAVKELIMERFDFFADQNGTGDSADGSASTATANGNADEINAAPVMSAEPSSSTHSASPQKPPADNHEPSDHPSQDIPPGKKRKADNDVDADAVFAAKLQAEENMRARPTRGTNTRKAAPAKKKAKSKPKTVKKVKAEDDSDVESGSDTVKKEVNRSGAFHVRWQPFRFLIDANILIETTYALACTFLAF